MSIVDAQSLGPSATLDTDLCVVGAGAAGITLAQKYADSGADVCLLEGGGLEPDERTQALYELDCTGYPVRENFMSRARYYGGSCNLWAGRSMCLSPFDLSRRPWVAHSGWPIEHAELAAFLPPAAKLMGLLAMDSFAQTYHRGNMGPGEEQLFEEQPLVPTVSLWGKKPMRFGARYRRKLQASRNARVVLHANATELHLDPAGRIIESLTARTLEGAQLTIRARRFVLACGGLENARLLLASRGHDPRGIGNRHDVVGRYFMDHPRAVFGRIRISQPARFPLLRGIPLRDGKVQFGVGLSSAFQEREGLLNHYVTFEKQVSAYTAARYQSFVQTMKVLLRRGHAGKRWEFGKGKLPEIPGMIYLITPKELVPHFAYRWYSMARTKLRPAPAEEERIMVYFCEQAPDPKSRVTLSDRRDALGMPRLELHWNLGSDVIDGVERLQGILAHELQRRGVGTLEPSNEAPAFTDASHHMGTTRMSADPETGVVDRDCRVHGVENLYLAGSSVFPSAGHANPTLTLVALALRLAQHLGQADGEA